MNPKTGKFVQSGGKLGTKLINNYQEDMVYNPLTKKMVKVGGAVGKKVMGGIQENGGQRSE